MIVVVNTFVNMKAVFLFGGVLILRCLLISTHSQPQSKRYINSLSFKMQALKTLPFPISSSSTRTEESLCAYKNRRLICTNVTYENLAEHVELAFSQV